MASRSFHFGWLLDVGEVKSRAGRSLLQERYRVLQRQMPLLYCIILANFLGLHVATAGQLLAVMHPATAVGALIVLRLVHWVRHRKRQVAPERIQRELRRTFFFALLFSACFSIWALVLFEAEVKGDQSYIIFFSSMAAVGSAFGLSSFPSAARVPLLVLGLPVAIQLILSPRPGFIAVGVSLVLVILLILRLLDIHGAGFAQLVESREGITVERERARLAEKVAKAEKHRANRIADTDPLTGLANRRALLRVLARRAGALGRSGGGFALAVVDLDGFKPINDTFGHAAGDAVLIEVGKRLQRVGGRQALVARMGGDEFALLLPGCCTRGQSAAAGARIRDTLQQAYRVEGRDFRISGCCGLTQLTPGDCNVAEALVRADTALYRAKQDGRAVVAVYSPEMEALHRRRSRIETALRSSETQQEIELLYQPICDLSTGQLRSFEALARWEDEELGQVSPAEFIPIAEQISVVSDLSDLLLVKAATEAKRWPTDVRLSFNLSAVQLCTAGCAERILSILQIVGLAPARLQVEVTETALLADFSAARDNLDVLRAAGTRIVLDDFGAGYASISYLREMKFDGIKLDGSLISSVTDAVSSQRLLKGLLDLCASLGLPCVAEHIETEAQLQLLRSLGCRDGQGFVLTRPMSGDAAAVAAQSAVPPAPRQSEAA